MKPFFSVIIPLYNKEKYIEKTIKSVLNQLFNDFEIIIVDDGSSDKSLNIVSEFNSPKIKIIKQSNKGAGAARNLGIYHAKADYIALLDADDPHANNHPLAPTNAIVSPDRTVRLNSSSTGSPVS